MLFVLTITILILSIVVVILTATIFSYIKKSIFLSKKEKDFLIFVINIFSEYGDELGIQSKEQHKILVDELEKIKSNYLN